MRSANTSNMGKEALVLREIRNEAFEGSSYLERLSEFSRITLKTIEEIAHHRILSHQDHGLASKTLANLMHLLGADIVD